MKNRILDRTYMLKKIPDFHLASLKEFGAKRFSEASLNQIIKDARTNKGSFYYRFPDKRELYFALLDDLFVTLQINIEAKNQSTGSDNDIESKFGCFLDALYECYVENQDYLSLAYNLYHETDELKRDVLDNCIPSPYDQLLAATINLLYSDSVSPDINEVSIKEVAYRLYCIPDFLGLHFTITEFEVYKTRTLNWLRSTSNSMKASILPDSNDVIASDSVNTQKFDLRELSLYKGDMIGIIGNHESGKTSLIKCLNEKTCTQLFEGEYSVALISPVDFYARNGKLRSFNKILFAENPLLTNKAVLNSFTRLMDEYNLRTRVYQMTKDSLVFASLLVALTKKPDVILIDQAMEWLNDRQKRRFFDILLKYKPKECTIIVTDFSLERLAPHVDKIAFMVSGKVLKTVLTENLTNEYGKPLIWVLYEGDDHQTAHECFPLEHPLSREVDDILRKRKILALNTTSGITEEVFKRETGVDLNE